MAEDRYVIAHDVGTGGSKAALTDLSGNIVALRFHPYETSYPQEHWAEQDPDDWWGAITSTSRGVLEDSGVDPGKVAGIVFATQMLGVLPVGRDGKPLRPAIIWLDGRAQDQADGLVINKTVTTIVKPVLLAIAGGLPTGKDVVAKVMWLREYEQEVYRETHKILEVDSYLVNRSCGEFVYDWAAASVTGAFNFKAKDWDQLLFKIMSLDPEKMPRVAPSYEKAGGLNASAAEEMGLPAGIPVFCGTGDVPAATVGSGAVLDGQGHVYIGSSGWLAVSVSKGKNDWKKGIYSIASADPDMRLMTSETESAGACFKWFSEHIAPRDADYGPGMDIMDYLNRVAAEAEPGSHGIIFCPWMYGERSPIPDTTVRGGFFNVSLDHKGRDVARAVFEGVALHARWQLEALRKLGFEDRVLRAIGGGAKSDLWMQIYADALGVSIERVSQPQHAGARGAALIAALGLGAYPNFASLRDAVTVDTVFTPREENRKVYDEAFETLKETYRSLKKLYRRVNTGEKPGREPASSSIDRGQPQ